MFDKGKVVSYISDCCERSKNRKFVQSFDVSIRFLVDHSKKNKPFKGYLNLPHGYGARLRILAVVSDEHVEYFSQSSLIDDVCSITDITSLSVARLRGCYAVLTSSSLVESLFPVARRLSSRGLMPNLSYGTVCDDIISVAKDIKENGRIFFRMDKYGIVHCKLGMENDTVENLSDNFLSAFTKIRDDYLDSVDKKGSRDILKSVALSTTMGGVVKIPIKFLKLV
ncbi:MAG: ribosomal L1p/L10e family protein [Candidatus Xenolissoclinum pacificiensis L6]|uniref:Large ribosomal subunit protein uL1 n=1 Tax=Candidatus Xenolissoclinum pacificiensis L6 TaxID=1401685 RepID=W2UZ95_9RICK|nr:MAG: ribosomal L1p/L10e family protein [Candidatus Xenolissoclinum pacificiensis L6]